MERLLSRFLPPAASNLAPGKHLVPPPPSLEKNCRQSKPSTGETPSSPMKDGVAVFTEFQRSINCVVRTRGMKKKNRQVLRKVLSESYPFSDFSNTKQKNNLLFPKPSSHQLLLLLLLYRSYRTPFRQNLTNAKCCRLHDYLISTTWDTRQKPHQKRKEQKKKQQPHPKKFSRTWKKNKKTVIEFRTSKVYPNVVVVCNIEFLEEEVDGMRILPLLLRGRRRQRGRSRHFRAREPWPEKRREEREKREESYGGSFRAARLSGGCYRSHRTTGGLLVVTYH